jgi:hypothetical protein
MTLGAAFRPRTLRTAAARWWLALVLCIVGFQSLGFVHGIAHAFHAAPASAHETATQASHDHHHDTPHGAGWLDRLFSDHASEQCRLLDGLAQPGPSVAPAAPEPLLASGCVLVTWPAGVLPAPRGDLFQARGPPFSR